MKRINPQIASGDNTKSTLIANRIRTILYNKRLNYSDLAKKMGTTQSGISRYTSGTHNFTLDTIIRLEHALEEPIMVIIK